MVFLVICPPGSNRATDGDSCLSAQVVEPPTPSKEFCSRIGANQPTYVASAKLLDMLSNIIPQLVSHIYFYGQL